MAIQVVRYDAGEGPLWAVHRDGALITLPVAYPTTKAFFENDGPQAARAAEKRLPERTIREVEILSPVTQDGDYICQATNYGSHLREVGRDPSSQTNNVFFTKASSCISSPNAAIVRPPHVKLLDYEIELALVIGTRIEGPIEVTEHNLHRFIGGWVMTNDISARDVQVSHEQFHKAKSYRTFGPTGPFLVLPDEGEHGAWGDLVLNLSVNGQLRQKAPASDMIFDPVRTLRELATIRDLSPGDMIATGTPSGVALKVPGKLPMFIGRFLSPEARFGAFLKGQMQNSRYLKPGDEVRSSISTSDGRITLGSQANLVVGG